MVGLSKTDRGGRCGDGDETYGEKSTVYGSVVFLTAPYHAGGVAWVG